MIVLTCARGGKKLQGKEEAAGKQVQCPHCAQVLLVPRGAGDFADLLEFVAWARA